ncbi:hypothetical protein GCM10027073_46240 [Streptomyces chlorus]|uniref:Cyclic nucleotide-binding domain-containing protein n=1 Tax=Streptomyces chlorus TaxID=887452 RepID=A0ABW1E1Q5_9ACTN
MVVRTGVFGAMTKEHREQFISLAREVSFAEGERILDEGGKADRFWIIRTGTVTLGLHVPGRRAARCVPTSSTRRRFVRCARRTRGGLTSCALMSPACSRAGSGSARVRLFDLRAPYGADEVP